MAHIKRQLGHNQIVRWPDRAGAARSVSLPPNEAAAILELAAMPVYAPGRPPAQTFDVLNALVTARPNIAIATRAGYEDFLKRHVAGTELGETDIRILNLAVVQRWLNSHVSARRAAGPLRHFLRVLLGFPVEAGFLEQAPVDLRQLVSPRKQGQPKRLTADETEPLTVEELKHLLGVGNSRDAGALHLLICGVEPAALLVLTCGEVDAAIEARELVCVRRWQTDASVIEPHPNGAVTWKLSSSAVEALKVMRDDRIKRCSWSHDAPVFPGRPDREPMRMGSFYYRLRTLFRRLADDATARGEYASAHRFAHGDIGVLRLTAAVIAARAGASYLDIATQLDRSLQSIRQQYRVWLDPVIER